MVKRLFLARHGESTANQEKLISGQTDWPLSEKGRQQAQWLCDVLKDEALTAIYATGLSRTVETARPAALHHGLRIQIEASLKERHFGLLEGKRMNGCSSKSDEKNHATEGGELASDFIRRISLCLESLLNNLNGPALIVGHRNTNEIILARLLNLDLKENVRINVKNKYVYEIEITPTPSINTIRLGGEFHGKKFPGLKDD